MKKFTLTALALVMILSLTACGGRRNDNSTNNNPNNSGMTDNGGSAGTNNSTGHSGNTMIENGMDNNADGGLMGELEDGANDVINGTENAVDDMVNGGTNAANRENGDR